MTLTNRLESLQEYLTIVMVHIWKIISHFYYLSITAFQGGGGANALPAPLKTRSILY